MAYLCKLACRATLLGALCLQTALVCAEPNNGWWWNPNESGRGFFIEQTDGVMYMGGYFYDASGRATWATSGGPVSDPYLYEGRLQTFAGGQSLFGAYRFPSSIVDIGAITIRFADDTHATLTWPGGSVAIERQVYGYDVEDDDAGELPLELFYAGDVPFQPQTGWWWNPDESGRGYSIEVQDSTLVLAGFMYDAGGNPQWYLALGPMTTDRHFESDLLLFSGGQTMTGPYQAPGPQQRVGRITIDFGDVDQATITVSDEAAAKALGLGLKQSQQRGHQAQTRPKHWAPNDQWPLYRGELTFVSHLVSKGDSSNSSATEDEKLVYKDIQWKKDYDEIAMLQGALAIYNLSAGTAEWSFHYHDTGSDCDDSVKATWSSTGSQAFIGSLTIWKNLTYSGWVKVGDGPQRVTENANCFEAIDANTKLTFGGTPKYRVQRMSSVRAPARNAPYVNGQKQFTLRKEAHVLPGSYATKTWSFTAQP
ncbi:MAG: hypothetical protein ACM34F_00240 [Betaproteobacteria bacterium]